jgi:hypothetical protein
MRGKGLHVVVEHGVLVVIEAEQPLCVGDAKVLEVEEAVRVVLAHELNEPAPCEHASDDMHTRNNPLVNKVVVLLTAKALMAPSLRRKRISRASHQ